MGGTRIAAVAFASGTYGRFAASATGSACANRPFVSCLSAAFSRLGRVPVRSRISRPSPQYQPIRPNQYVAVAGSDSDPARGAANPACCDVHVGSPASSGTCPRLCFAAERSLASVVARHHRPRRASALVAKSRFGTYVTHSLARHVARKCRCHFRQWLRAGCEPAKGFVLCSQNA